IALAGRGLAVAVATPSTLFLTLCPNIIGAGHSPFPLCSHPIPARMRLHRCWSDPIYPHSVHPVRCVCIRVGRWYRFLRRTAATTDCSPNIIGAGHSAFPLCSHPIPARMRLHRCWSVPIYPHSVHPGGAQCTYRGTEIHTCGGTPLYIYIF